MSLPPATPIPGEAPAARVDLHMHSTASDGSQSPDDVVAAALASGVSAIALTDHDTVAGVDEALAAAAELGGIQVIPAVEISALDGPHEDLHICGYLVDHHAACFTEALGTWRADRAARAHRMADALREAGLELDFPHDEGEGHAIGRPHLAAAVLAHPANARRLADDGLTDHAQVLEAYLLPGTPGYRRRTTPTIAEAIAAIHEAGGLAVWAHPFWDVHDPEDVGATITRFAGLGIDGVEAFYTAHTEAETRFAVQAARDNGLLTTGSADFHGPHHPRFSRFRAFELYDLEPDLGRIGPGPG